MLNFFNYEDLKLPNEFMVFLNPMMILLMICRYEHELARNIDVIPKYNQGKYVLERLLFRM